MTSKATNIQTEKQINRSTERRTNGKGERQCVRYHKYNSLIYKKTTFEVKTVRDVPKSIKNI